MVTLLILCIVSKVLPAQENQAPGDRDRVSREVDGVVITAIPRTPEQMAAFYEARGFPDAMLAIVRERCFITFRVHNTRRDVVWLDLDLWTFTGPQGVVQRLDRDWWKARWKEVEAPMPNQSTFRWTLIPEQLDYRPDEAEGGNITLVPVRTPFHLDAVFPTGPDRDGGEIQVRMNNLRCAEDTP